jgi:hypothetical protein
MFPFYLQCRQKSAVILTKLKFGIGWPHIQRGFIIYHQIRRPRIESGIFTNIAEILRDPKLYEK